MNYNNLIGKYFLIEKDKRIHINIITGVYHNKYSNLYIIDTNNSIISMNRKDLTLLKSGGKVCYASGAAITLIENTDLAEQLYL